MCYVVYKIDNGYVLFYRLKFNYRYINFIRIYKYIRLRLLFLLSQYIFIYKIYYSKFILLFDPSCFLIFHILPLTENIYVVSPKLYIITF